MSAINALDCNCLFVRHHLRNERGTGAETRPAIVSGIVNGDAQLSYWTIFPLALVTVPGVFAKVNSAHFPRFYIGECNSALTFFR